MTLLVKAQSDFTTNIQVMYDFGKDREYVTTTLEMYKADRWGGTFFFVDIYHNKFDKAPYSPQGAYTEIARTLNFWQKTKLSAFSAHVEYTGGLGMNEVEETINKSRLDGYGIGNSWLFGAEYFIHDKNYKNLLTFEILYKTMPKGVSSNCPIRFTLLWTCNDLLGVRGLTFKGFAYLWGEKKCWIVDNENKETEGVFLTEPQLWYNVGQWFNCPNLNIGGEAEISANFCQEGACINPCLGIKWNF